MYNFLLPIAIKGIYSPCGGEGGSSLPMGEGGGRGRWLGQFPTTSIAPSYEALYLISLSPLSPFTMKPLLLRSYSLSH